MSSLGACLASLCVCSAASPRFWSSLRFFHGAPRVCRGALGASGFLAAFFALGRFLPFLLLFLQVSVSSLVTSGTPALWSLSRSLRSRCVCRSSPSPVFHWLAFSAAPACFCRARLPLAAFLVCNRLFLLSFFFFPSPPSFSCLAFLSFSFSFFFLLSSFFLFPFFSSSLSSSPSLSSLSSFSSPGRREEREKKKKRKKKKSPPHFIYLRLLMGHSP